MSSPAARTVLAMAIALGVVAGTAGCQDQPATASASSTSSTPTAAAMAQATASATPTAQATSPEPTPTPAPSITPPTPSTPVPSAPSPHPTQPARHPSASAAPAPAPAASDIKQVGEQTLRSLPANAGVSLAWDDPGLAGHLGGVFEGTTDRILINSARLAGQPSKTRDVVRHEMAHIYQGRLEAVTGLTWDQIKDLQSSAFGSNASEKIADCVAIRFGATWTNYTHSCSSPAQQAWVSALIDGRLP